MSSEKKHKGPRISRQKGGLRRAAEPAVRDDSMRRSAYGAEGEKAICVNAQCKLRKEGCRGFEGCPGYKGRD